MSAAPTIYELIDSGRWDDLRQKLRLNVRDIFFSSPKPYEDMVDASPFLLACSKEDVPQDVITAMLAIDSNNLRTRLKPAGATPLHLACEMGSAETVRTLLKCASDEGIARECASAEDQAENNALHAIWARHIYPDCESYICDDLDISDTPSEFFHRLDEINSPEDLTGCIKDTWEKTILLVKAYTTGTVDASFVNGGQWNVVHSIAELSTCPSIALWLALKFFPEQAQWKNRRGDLPLHISASNDGFCRAPIPDDLDDKAKSIHEQTREPPFAMLLRCYPDAAKVPDSKGHLPLHLLLENQVVCGTTVVSFVKAAPESVNTRDADSKLFPFMQAACDLQDSDDDEEEDESEEGTKLDATYILLRANPANVQGGIHQTEYENYLAAKLTQEKERAKQQRDRDLARIAELESIVKKRKRGDDC